MSSTRFIAGLDLGQAQDYTALAILERVDRDRQSGQRLPQAHFLVRHIERAELGTPYPAVVARVRTLLDGPDSPLRVSAAAPSALMAPGGGSPSVTLIADATGVGRPVLDLFRAAGLRAPLVGVTITGGDTVTRDSSSANSSASGRGYGSGYVGYHVPKRDLATGVQAGAQSGRLRIVRGLGALESVLVAELANFQVKISLATGHDTYEAGGTGGGLWREGAHDDLVLAVALAYWWGANGPASRDLVQDLEHMVELRAERARLAGEPLRPY